MEMSADFCQCIRNPSTKVHTHISTFHLHPCTCTVHEEFPNFRLDFYADIATIIHISMSCVSGFDVFQFMAQLQFHIHKMGVEIRRHTK